MNAIQTGELPLESLLRRHKAQGAFTDCYFIDVPGAIGHARYVEAFYTSAVFKVERFILRWLARKPSSDRQARELAAGRRDRFAAWTVEARATDQLLMCDFMNRTRSWLMSVELPQTGGATGTRLYFGSAVVPHQVSASGEGRLNWLFRSLMGFHEAYSKVLLWAAVARLKAIPHTPGDLA
ncbi:MAG: hypothetical protein EOP36_12325 [Rubrivivax sp.]|nr:MAG: hypothetical protein EOP36_12325 [Rubrivivax sp.]